MTAAREELARLIFTTDNGNAKDPAREWEEYLTKHGPETYAHNIADGLLAAGYEKRAEAAPEPAPEPSPARVWPDVPEHGDREYRQAQWDHARTPERYGGGLG